MAKKRQAAEGPGSPLLALSDNEIRKKREVISKGVIFTYDSCVEELRDRRVARTNARIVAMTVVIAAATVANVVASILNALHP